MDQFKFSGDESQVDIQQRYYRLWQYLKAHPRLSFVGRAIGIDDPALDEVEKLAGLTMELGFLAMMFTRAADLVHTGVREDNDPSKRVCRNCGLIDSGMYYLGAIYRQMVEQAEFTRWVSHLA